MKTIEIMPLSNGAHRNQTVSGAVTAPDGWAVIPEGMAIPETFPFVDLVVKDGKVVSMTAGVVPEPEQLRADVDFLSAMMGVSL